MCEPDNNNNDPLDRLNDGTTTNSQDYTITPKTDTKQENLNRKSEDVKVPERVIHETWNSYDTCYYRERNMNLFTADQNLQKNVKGYSSAIHTRQNPNGGRSGYECPEERDYYPYWHPTAWKDIAILASEEPMCESLYKPQSFNVKPKNLCVENYGNDKTSWRHWSRWNNRNDCERNSGRWVEYWNYLEKANQFKDEASCERNGIKYKWALPYDAKTPDSKECIVLLDAPVCRESSWSRTNHLGNDRNGEASRFQWELPHFPSNNLQKCVLRVRYNISTDDYDPFNTDARWNTAKKSPVVTNPQVKVDKHHLLKLALNTAQTGRVFQDRSHSFYLMARPTSLIPDDNNIYNLNVRGKRGNIVQVYPGVEYDFIPNELKLRSQSDILHIQWTGSNTHKNGPPGGDGQTGDDGQGQTATDRNNFVEMISSNDNFPLPFENGEMWQDIELIGYLNSNITSDISSSYIQSSKSLKSNDIIKDLAIYLATSGYYKCEMTMTCGADSVESELVKLNADLNNSPASLPGALIKFKKSNKTYYYMSTRNNNFSNRSQKGKLFIN
jgi:hypothetical protein